MLFRSQVQKFMEQSHDQAAFALASLLTLLALVSLGLKVWLERKTQLQLAAAAAREAVAVSDPTGGS